MAASSRGPAGSPSRQAANRTGEVASIDERLLELLLGSGFLPVLSSVSSSTEGLGLNINADSLAFGIAAHLKAAALVFFSDIPGILCDGSVLQAPSAAEARELISRGVITGGMIPKVTASLDALERGVQKVIIGQYESRGSLAGSWKENKEHDYGNDARGPRNGHEPPLPPAVRQRAAGDLPRPRGMAAGYRRAANTWTSREASR